MADVLEQTVLLLRASAQALLGVQWEPVVQNYSDVRQERDSRMTATNPKASLMFGPSAEKWQELAPREPGHKLHAASQTPPSTEF